MPFNNFCTDRVSIPNLRESRRKANLSLRELQAASGVHFTTLSHYEHGLAAKPDHVARLAAALKTTSRQLGAA